MKQKPNIGHSSASTYGAYYSLCYLLWFEHRCSPSSVASQLAFHPPSPPSYSLRVKEDDEGAPEIVFSTLYFPDVRDLTTRISRLLNSCSTSFRLVRIPSGVKNAASMNLFVFSHRKPRFTILYVCFL
jgi:hypothetical protein